MFIGDLTKYELARFKVFRKNCVCPICKKPVELCDGFEMLKLKYAANTHYTFMHTNCLLSQLNNRRYQNGKESSES